MNILLELDYLSEMLKKSSETTIALGEEILQACQKLKTPDNFKTADEANQFLFTLSYVVGSAVHNLTGVIANSVTDDLGNQSINRIRKIILEQKESDPTLVTWSAGRLNQDSVDELFSLIASKGCSHGN